MPAGLDDLADKMTQQLVDAAQDALSSTSSTPQYTGTDHSSLRTTPASSTPGELVRTPYKDLTEAGAFSSPSPLQDHSSQSKHAHSNMQDLASAASGAGVRIIDFGVGAFRAADADSDNDTVADEDDFEGTSLHPTPPPDLTDLPDWNDKTGIQLYDEAKEQAKADKKKEIRSQGETPTKDDIKEIERNFAQQYCDSRSDAGLKRYFVCSALAKAQSDCTSKQEWGPLEEFARTVTSDFFGGNKNSWQGIPPEFKIFFCRKCYQHNKFNMDKKPIDYAHMKIELIQRQLARLEDWNPANMYKIQLSVALYQKLTRFYELARSPELTDEDAAAQADEECRDECLKKTEDKKTKKSSAKAKKTVEETDKLLSPIAETPTLFAEGLKHRFCSTGPTKTKGDIEELLAFIVAELGAGRIDIIPPVEFLLDWPAAKEKYVKTPRKTSRKIDNNNGENNDDEDNNRSLVKKQSSSTPIPSTKRKAKRNVTPDSDDTSGDFTPAISNGSSLGKSRPKLNLKAPKAFKPLKQITPSKQSRVVKLKHNGIKRAHVEDETDMSDQRAIKKPKLGPPGGILASPILR